MPKKKNKRIKNIGHKPTVPRTKKEKEPTKGGPSGRRKRVTCSPLPPTTPKGTPWFSEEHYEASYKFSYAKKEMIQPKYVNLVWLRSEGFPFLELIEHHGLKKLVEMKGTYYTDLVKVFYTTTHIDGDTEFLCVDVKGQQIVMTPKVWFGIVGLSSKGVMANQLGLKEARFSFNKVEKYKSMMNNPSTYDVVVTKSKGKECFGTRPLMLQHRLLAYVVAWIITPRGRNHAQLIEEDLLLISLMQGKLKINWVNIIFDIMLKTKRIGFFKYPYAILVSRILDYFGVDTQEEVFCFFEEKFEVKTKVLK